MRRDKLIRVLSFIQNRACNWNRDILTITGCGMSDGEVSDHVMAEFRRLPNDDRAACVAYAFKTSEA